MRKKYVYYISYYFEDIAWSKGFGSAKITLDYKIKTFDDLMDVKRRVQSENNYNNIIIIYFTRMKK